jgi:hypothetical protein
MFRLNLRRLRPTAQGGAAGTTRSVPCHVRRINCWVKTLPFACANVYRKISDRRAAALLVAFSNTLDATAVSGGLRDAIVAIDQHKGRDEDERGFSRRRL